MLSKQEAQAALDNSEIIFTEQQVQAAVLCIAEDIKSTMADMHPLVLSVMGGAVVFTGQLLPLLNFPLDFDYVHVSRYGNSQQGGEMKWKVAPQENVRGRVVLVVDDILDEGETLRAVKERVMALGATNFYSAIFADKLNGKTKPIKADFVGLQVPDRFVFGYGMDIHGAWRNLPAIYAVKGK
jgi:hypoxanthine phosphoribosyltransferase